MRIETFVDYVMGSYMTWGSHNEVFKKWIRQLHPNDVVAKSVDTLPPLSRHSVFGCEPAAEARGSGGRATTTTTTWHRNIWHVRENLTCDKNRAGQRTVQLSINSSLAAPSLETPVYTLILSRRYPTLTRTQVCGFSPVLDLRC